MCSFWKELARTNGCLPMLVLVFCVVALWGLVRRYKRLFSSQKMETVSSSKRWYLPTWPYGVSIQKTNQHRHLHRHKINISSQNKWQFLLWDYSVSRPIETKQFVTDHFSIYQLLIRITGFKTIPYSPGIRPYDFPLD